MALRTGQELNKENIASAIGISVKTVDNWLDILEKPGLIIDSASKITPINEKAYIYPIHLIGA